MHKLICWMATAILLAGCSRDDSSVSQQGVPSTDVTAVRKAIETANAGLITDAPPAK
jgi:uncharacterized membrane protein